MSTYFPGYALTATPCWSISMDNCVEMLLAIQPCKVLYQDLGCEVGQVNMKILRK